MLTYPRQSPRSSPAGPDEAFGLIHEMAAALDFGTITLVIHEGKLTQMEVTEKRRFAP